LSVEYDRTAFIPSLNGQYKVLKKDVLKVCNQSDYIFQLGNLIGCNPFVADKETQGANEAILSNTLMYRATDENWVQIVGSNEIAALNNPEEWTNQNSRKILRDAWLGDTPSMMTASSSSGRLVTHGGLTYGEWVLIGRPDTAEEAADRLNEKYSRTLYQGPSFRLGNPPNYSANPIWADTFMELYPSWITALEPMPFDQIHGSYNLNTERGRLLLGKPENPLYYIDHLNFRKWGSITDIKGMIITGIDLDLPPEIISSVPSHKSLYVEKQKAES